MTDIHVFLEKPSAKGGGSRKGRILLYEKLKLPLGFGLFPNAVGSDQGAVSPDRE